MSPAIFGSGLAARVLILTAVGGAPATEADVHARIDEVVTLHAALRVDGPGRGRCVLYTDAPRVNSTCTLRPPLEGARVAWEKLEAAEKAYDNVPGGRFQVAAIDWVASAWRAGAWSEAADVTPVAREGIAHGLDVPLSRAGTMRFRALITLDDGTVFASPRPEDGLRGGPPHDRDARKVSLRLDDGYLGLLTELGGLPYIFGSTALGREPHQAERGIGVDCADLVIYGLRRLGHDLDYRSSRTLGPVSRSVVPGPVRRADRRYVDGRGLAIRVGAGGVQPGDWVIFAGHVGAFFQDRGERGVLDDQDLLVHTVWREVAVEPLVDTGYADAPFEVRRALLLERGER